VITKGIVLAVRREPALAQHFPRAACAGEAGSRSLIEHVRDRPGHDRCYAVDGGKIARLGFELQTPLATGLAATVRWYLDNESWWRSIVSGEYRGWYERQYAPPHGSAAPSALGGPEFHSPTAASLPT
jgi:dTDP-glucose 4,6-dehydratase